MKNKINWKNATLTLLASSNLFLVNKVIDASEDASSANFWYQQYKDVSNELYLLEVESGFYNEYPIESVGMRNPHTGELVERNDTK